jgi:hypothetical protein
MEVNKMTDEQFDRLMFGKGIESKSLFHGEGPTELIAFYEKWQKRVLEIKHPSFFSKNVALYFIYQGIRYELSPYEFDLYVKAVTGKENLKISPRGLDGAIAEKLFDEYVIPDLRKMGVKDEDIIFQGSLD